MEHFVRFTEGYDCIKFECINESKLCKPGSGGSHGRHGMNIRFISKGEQGAVQFVLYTGWLPQFVSQSNIGYREIKDWGHTPIPADLGYHSKSPMYDGQTVIDNSCEWCDGNPCYYDGSWLNASDAVYSLLNGGDKVLWSFLDGYYKHVFNGEEYPKPAEFSKPLRGVEVKYGPD